MSNALHSASGRKGHALRKQRLLCTALFLFSLLATACGPSIRAAPTATPGAVEYHNSQYRFTFALPPSWRGYSVIVGSWTGMVNDPAKGDVPAAQGPLISIRHPLWSAQDPRQDIPIMVFTQAQWAALQRTEFWIGAAPVPPSELGRNADYVFALPARYNYAFLTGWQEVEQILSSHPLRTP